MKKWKLILALCSLLLTMPACSPAIEITTTPTSSPTPDRTATALIPAQTETQAARDAQASAQAETLAAAETLSANQTATSVVMATGTAASIATSRAATAQARASATTQAQSLADRVQELVANGYLTSAEGAYHLLPNFDASWARLGGYYYEPTLFAPTNFVLRVDASWDSASSSANWFQSGCGFVFRERSVEDHYFAYLGLDGNAYMSAFVNGSYKPLGRSYYGKVDIPAGEAELILVVEGTTFRLFVNGELVHTANDLSHPQGGLAFTVVSGTNKEWGTRCVMSEVELWELDT